MHWKTQRLWPTKLVCVCVCVCVCGGGGGGGGGGDELKDKCNYFGVLKASQLSSVNDRLGNHIKFLLYQFYNHYNYNYNIMIIILISTWISILMTC